MTAIQLNEENGGKLINVHVSGKLVKADYEHFVPEFERLVRQRFCGYHACSKTARKSKDRG